MYCRRLERTNLDGRHLHTLPFLVICVSESGVPSEVDEVVLHLVRPVRPLPAHNRRVRLVYLDAHELGNSLGSWHSAGNVGAPPERVLKVSASLRGPSPKAFTAQTRTWKRALRPSEEEGMDMDVEGPSVEKVFHSSRSASASPLTRIL